MAKTLKKTSRKSRTVAARSKVAKVTAPVKTARRSNGFKVGGKVRVLDDNGKPMKKVFTILPVERNEPHPGPDYFAVTDQLFVHRSDLIAA